MSSPRSRQEALTEFEAAAARARLSYVSDSEPGIRRRKAGRGFGYTWPDGRRVEDRPTLARIRSLAVPPAWTDVWIAPDLDGHIQATGRDQKGRKQYRYHPAWLECRDETKFLSLVSFAEALPKLRAAADADLRRHGMPRTRVIAAIVWLLDRTLMRIGNDAYAQQNNSFGLTTLRNNHLHIEGASMNFRFTGKSGHEWAVKLTDRRIAKVMRTVQELPGQHLFQYVDETGECWAIRSQDVNDYIRAEAGPAFSSKDFRTWAATVAAAALLSRAERPAAKRARARSLNEAIDRVARRLHNTRAVCRSGYIHPRVLEAWEEGRLAGEMAEMAKRYRRPLKGLDRRESLVLRWLRRETQDWG